MSVSIDTFSVGNPNDLPINTVGYEEGLIPAGFDGADFELPFLYGYSGPAQATVFTYAGDLTDPFSTLDPDEWSLVWYIAEAPTWELGPGTGSGGGISDTQFIPVAAIPAPGVLALLALGGLTARRRR